MPTAQRGSPPVGRRDVGFSSSGTSCKGWLYEGEDADASWALVVMANGFGGVRAGALETVAERFAQAGLTVLLFDYRHAGTSDGLPRGLVDPRLQRDDYRAAAAYLRRQEGLTAPLVLWGTSFSAGHVCAVAAADAGIAAVLAQNPYVDGPAALHHAATTTGPAQSLRLVGAWLRDELAATLKRAPHRVPLVGAPGTTAVFTAPGAMDGYRSVLPADPAAAGWEPRVPARVLLRMLTDRPADAGPRISCPLLVSPCADDTIAPVGPAIRLARSTPRGEHRLLPGADHFDVFVPPLREQLADEQVAFLRRVVLA